MNTEVLSEQSLQRPILSLFIGTLLLLFSLCTLLALSLFPEIRDSVDMLADFPSASLLLSMLGAGYLLCCLLGDRHWRIRAQRILSTAMILLSGALLYLSSQGTTQSIVAYLPATNSLLAYLIVGIAALLNSSARSLSQLATIFFLILLVAALAIFGLAAYSLGYEPFFKWNALRHMSPVTAISLLLLASGLSYTTWWCHRRNSFDPVGGITVISSILLIFAAMIGAGLIYAVAASYLHFETRNDLVNLLNERSARIVEKLHHAEELALLLADEAQQAGSNTLALHKIAEDYALKVTDSTGSVIASHNADWFDKETVAAISSKQATLWRGKEGHCQYRLIRRHGDRMIESSVPFDLSAILNASRQDRDTEDVILCGYLTNGSLRCLTPKEQPQPPLATLLAGYAEVPTGKGSRTRLYASNSRILALMDLKEYALLAYMENDDQKLFSPLYERLYFVLPLALLLIGASIGLIAWRIHPLAKQLHRSEKRYRTLVDGAADAIFLHSRNRRFLEASPAAATLLGYSRSELIGKHPNDFLLPEDQDDALKQFQKLNHKHTIITSRRELRRKDGNKISVEIRTTALDSGELISVVRDFSEQERTEAALRDKERFTRTVVEVLAEGVIVYQRDGVIVYTNRAALTILGQEDLVSARVTPYDSRWSIIHEDHTPYVADDYPPVCSLRQGISLRNVIMGVMRPDGERVWISVNSDPLLDEQTNDVIGAVISFSNITKKRETERAFYLSRERLRALSNHLQQVREEEKSLIAREIHDELGSSLTAIKMGVEWIAERGCDESQELRDRITHISDVTDQAIKATRRLVTQLRPSILEDLGLWAALEWLLRDLSANSDITVSHHINCGDTELSPQSALAIYRVIQEALNNVAKHAHASKVRLDCWLSDESLHLTLEDNGVGVDDDTAFNINSYGIRGMYERIGQINGHLQILSSPGEGTLISLSIPIRANTSVEIISHD